jgi:hypothetical protein
MRIFGEISVADRPSTDKDGRLIVTTETRRNFRKRRFVLIGMSWSGASLSLLTCLLGPTPSIVDAETLIFLHIMCIIGGILWMRGTAWGTWVITPQSIEFSPCFSASKRLYWRDLVKVKWDYRRATFKGSTQIIAIPWIELPVDEGIAAKKTIERLLSDEFDLKDPWESVNFWKSLFSVTKSLDRFAMVVAAIAVWLGASLWLLRGEFMPVPLARIVIIYMSFFLLFLWLGVVGRNAKTFAKEAHPEWPWRLRRREPARPI